MLLGLKAAGQPIDEHMLAFWLTTQCEDGGFSRSTKIDEKVGCTSNVDSTGLVAQALSVTKGKTTPASRRQSTT